MLSDQDRTNLRHLADMRRLLVAARRAFADATANGEGVESVRARAALQEVDRYEAEIQIHADHHHARELALREAETANTERMLAVKEREERRSAGLEARLIEMAESGAGCGVAHPGPRKAARA